MAQRDVIRPKCGKVMRAGFVPDYSYSKVLEGKWYEGKFEAGWLGLKLRGAKAPLPITTYRCTSCGYLESYAA